MALDIDTVFRDNKIKGDIHSGEHEPDKAEIRALLKGLLGGPSNPSIVKQTKAALDLITPASENYGGLVLNDPDPAKNGYYYRSASVWVKGRGFPDTFAEVVLSGSGTAQTGTISAAISPADVIVFFASVETENTGPLTLSIANEGPRAVVNASGNPVTAGEWTGAVIFFLNGDGNYQLLFDAGAVAAAALSATIAGQKRDEAEEFRDQAEAFAALSGPTGVYAGVLTGDGEETTFTLPVAPTSEAHVWVAIDGVMQAPGTYAVDGADLIFSQAPPATAADNISYRIVSIADGEEVPPDGSVTASKLGSKAVTRAKVDDDAIGADQIDASEAEDIRTKLGLDDLILSSVKTQIFSTNGTYTPSTGMAFCIVEAIGGGGGGGGAKSASGSGCGAGGGGAGGYSRKRLTAADIGASKTVTIGAGGTAGAATPTAGGNGGDTSLGTLVIAKGGAGGASATTSAGGAGGAGGVAGTGDFVPAGSAGGFGSGSSTTTTSPTSGSGGAGPFGGAGAGRIQNNSGLQAGSAGAGSGSGGGGAVEFNQSTGAAGGAGSAGIIIITEYCR